jgi:hypothetical protein
MYRVLFVFVFVRVWSWRSCPCQLIMIIIIRLVRQRRVIGPKRYYFSTCVTFVVMCVCVCVCLCTYTYVHSLGTRFVELKRIKNTPPNKMYCCWCTHTHTQHVTRPLGLLSPDSFIYICKTPPKTMTSMCKTRRGRANHIYCRLGDSPSVQ